MLAQFIDRIVGRRASSASTGHPRRPSRRLAAATGQAMQALESRVMLSVLYVDINAPGPTHNGASWATAYKDLQLALGASTAGTEIRIADGTYKPTQTTDRTISFPLRNGVTIRGGYAGHGAGDPDARNVVAFPTILSGDIGAAGNNADNSYHVVIAGGVGAMTVLDGVTITAGNANGTGANQMHGGGLLATGALLTLLNCTFSGNSATHGGGMYNTSSSAPKLTNCLFIANSAASFGGAIYNTASSPALINCTFSGNFAGISGGGLYSTSGSSPQLTNCILWANVSRNDPQMAQPSGTATITYSIIQGGYAGVGNLSANPMFVRTPWTGPDGVFGTGDDDPGDLRLRPGSPALNVGSNAAISGVEADLAGNARIQGNVVDMGVYEGAAAAPAPKVIHVDIAATNGVNTGVSWADAFTSLQSALAAAGDGDTIRIADGIYRPTPTAGRTMSFALRERVAIYGGYGGRWSTNPGARDVFLYPTVLSGDIGTGGNNADNSYHVVTAMGVGTLTLLDGVSIRDGNANGSAPNQMNGGGVLVVGGSPTFINCTISNNTASSGGGMYTTGSAPALVDCVFSGNSAINNGGGGMANWSSSSPAITNCRFINNSANNTTGGGGMYNNYCSPTLTHCTFSGNSASGGPGGGMANLAASPILINCNFSGNTAARGGAMSNDFPSSPTLTNCTFSENMATGGSTGDGGAIYNTSSSPILVNCTLINNRAANYGGGIYNLAASPKLTNCVIWGNTAIGSSSDGGGIYISGASPTLTNCVIWGNSTRRFGGGIYNSAAPLALVNCTVGGNMAMSGGGIHDQTNSAKLTNCILWGNVAETAPQMHPSSSAGITYSVIQGGYAGVGNLGMDPQFVRYPWEGSDGVFGTADDDFGDLRLRFGSPAVNAGSNAALPAGVSSDLAGNARIQSGTIDLGAYEGTAAPPAPKIIYVDRAATTGTSTGLSWVNAFTNLPAAMAAAGDGDTIRIAQGVYKPTGTDRNASFFLRNGVAIYGGYAGHGAPDPDARNIALHPTILSGDLGSPGTKADNSYHVVTAFGLDASTLLDGVTVSDGNANGLGAISYGGGLYVTGSSLRLIQCTLSNNSAVHGGAMYTYSASPTLINCTFSGNVANGSGGAVYNQLSTPTLVNCVIHTNAATGSGSGHGGGMYNQSSSPTLINCTISGNRARAFGGGIYSASSSSPRLTNCIVWGNTNGAIYNGHTTATPVITYSIIQGGYAGAGNLDADPLFVRTSWTGPDGLFGTADDDHGNLRLREGSPALNAGANGALPADVSTDLAGNARIHQGTVDMGAYEAAASTAAPKVLYVDARADGANTGVSWANAFTSVQSALAAAFDGDTIRVAQGTYRPTNSGDRNASFALRNGVAIHGGYAGYGASDPDARDTALYPTVLSGNIGLAASRLDNSYHVLTASGVGSLTVIDGVNVRDGNANGSAFNQTDGGGIYVVSASPRLINCVFSNNSAVSGGAIANSYFSSPTLINCTFQDNSAEGDGGGMFNSQFSSPHLIDCTFRKNVAGGYGGGMANASSSPTVTRCIFSGNQAGADGGGMSNRFSSSPGLTGCTFSGNTSRSGGGMYNHSLSSPALTNCTFIGNVADNGGGMYNTSSSSPTLVNCTLSGNLVAHISGSGGAVHNSFDSSPTLINCVLSGNSAVLGGAMYIESSAPRLTNCIVWGNRISINSPIYRTGTGTPVITYSNIQGGYVGTGNINADPLFVRNPAPGPDGNWGTADDDFGDLRLRPESPCIDAGNNNVPGLAGITTDLAGRPRFVDIPHAPNTGLGTPPIIDMGAYEVQSWCPHWLDPAELATWNPATQTIDIGQHTLTIATDDANRLERLAAVRQFIVTARSGGAGIVSSAAADNQWLIPTLDEQGQILVRLALIGDVTLDDRLDGDDYFALDRAFLFSAGLMSPAADLNLDGQIDAHDYFVLDRAFLTAMANVAIEPSAAMPIPQAAQQPRANPFSTRPIAEDLLLEEAPCSEYRL